MKVSGFTFVRNAVKFDYPVVEAITSILPLCDEVVVAVGKSDDGTLEIVRSIHPSKIRIIETVWDESRRTGGRVLAEETNKAFQALAPDADWAFYIQADEVVHERDIETIREGMMQWKNDLNVDGLLFNYIHFYGSYQYVADSYNWYQKEIRVIRNRKNIYSYGDAQGFRKDNDVKLRVKPIEASIYHYGWAKHPVAQQRKQEVFHKWWHADDWVEKNVLKANGYDYSRIDSLKKFVDTHPEVMKQRVAAGNWKFDFDIAKSRMKWKYRVRKWLKEKCGINIGEYKNYRIV